MTSSLLGGASARRTNHVRPACDKPGHASLGRLSGKNGSADEEEWVGRRLGRVIFLVTVDFSYAANVRPSIYNVKIKIYRDLVRVYRLVLRVAVT